VLYAPGNEMRQSQIALPPCFWGHRLRWSTDSIALGLQPSMCFQVGMLLTRRRKMVCLFSVFVHHPTSPSHINHKSTSSYSSTFHNCIYILCRRFSAHSNLAHPTTILYAYIRGRTISLPTCALYERLSHSPQPCGSFIAQCPRAK
jgi:hypothetical protein